MKIMASSPITSWQIDGETMETVTGFIFLGSKITADGNCNHKIKRCLFLGRKAMANLDNEAKKWRHHFANKDLFVKTIVFPVAMYGCESWTIKKAESESVSRSVVSDSLQSHGLYLAQAPLSMEFSREEYWSGLPLSSPGDNPDPGVKSRSPTLQADSLPS